MRKAGDVCFAEVSRDSEGITFADSRDNSFMFVCQTATLVVILTVKYFPSLLKLNLWL